MNIRDIQSLIHHNKYKHNWCEENLDLPEILSTRFQSPHSDGKGSCFFSITPAFARFLLYNLRHKEMKHNKAKSICCVIENITKGGARELNTTKSVKIDINTNTIVDGTLRLYGLAQSDVSGVMLEIELVV